VLLAPADLRHRSAGVVAQAPAALIDDVPPAVVLNLHAPRRIEPLDLEDVDGVRGHRLILRALLLSRVQSTDTRADSHCMGRRLVVVGALAGAVLVTGLVWGFWPHSITTPEDLRISSGRPTLSCGSAFVPSDWPIVVDLPAHSIDDDLRNQDIGFAAVDACWGEGLEANNTRATAVTVVGGMAVLVVGAWVVAPRVRTKLTRARQSAVHARLLRDREGYWRKRGWAPAQEVAALTEDGPPPGWVPTSK
jgi:hypothetical protein